MTLKKQVRRQMEQVHRLFDALKTLPQLAEFDDPDEEEAWRIADGIVDIVCSSETLILLARQIEEANSETRKLEILAEIGVELNHIKNHIETMRSYRWT